MDKQSALGLINPNVRALGAYSITGGQNAEIKLNQNENPRDLPLELKKLITEEFLAQPWNRYPDIFPQAGAAQFADFIDVPHDWVMMGNGSNELLYTIFMAVLHPNASILIPTPSFSLYEKIAKVLGAEVIEVQMNKDLSFNAKSIIEEAQKRKPELIVISTPNNPTSQSMDLETIEKIIKESPSLVLVDEAYIEFSKQKSAVSLIDKYPNVMVLRTFSKAFSLAGLRIGFAITNPELKQEIIKPKIPFASSHLAEITLKHVLGNYSLIQEGIDAILAERSRVQDALQTIQGVVVFESDANFLIARFNDAKSVFEALKSEGILVRDVSSYPLMENCLRINIGSPEENNALLVGINKALNG